MTTRDREILEQLEQLATELAAKAAATAALVVQLERQELEQLGTEELWRRYGVPRERGPACLPREHTDRWPEATP